MSYSPQILKQNIEAFFVILLLLISQACLGISLSFMWHGNLFTLHLFFWWMKFAECFYTTLPHWSLLVKRCSTVFPPRKLEGNTKLHLCFQLQDFISRSDRWKSEENVSERWVDSSNTRRVFVKTHIPWVCFTIVIFIYMPFTMHDLHWFI